MDPHAKIQVLQNVDLMANVVGFLDHCQADDMCLKATSRAVAVGVRRALKLHLCGSADVVARLTRQLVAEAKLVSSQQRDICIWALEALGMCSSGSVPACGGARDLARLVDSQEPLLDEYFKVLCLRLLREAHKSGYVRLAFMARKAISIMRGLVDRPHVLAFLDSVEFKDARPPPYEEDVSAPDTWICQDTGALSPVWSYCHEDWPEAYTPSDIGTEISTYGWPIDRFDWDLEWVEDGLAPGGRASAKIQCADRGGPVRTPFPHRLSISNPGREPQEQKGLLVLVRV